MPVKRRSSDPQGRSRKRKPRRTVPSARVVPRKSGPARSPLPEASAPQSEDKYRRLHESMMDAFCQVDMSGKLLEPNRAFCEMLGYSPEELHHLTYVEITPVKWHSMEAKLIEDQVLRRGFSDVYEKEYIRKDGTVFPIELRTVLVRDEGGRPAAMWGVVRDITERKRIEEQLQKSREQQRALTVRIESLLEAERTRISREIHDELGQALTALKMDLRWLEDNLSSSAAPTGPLVDRAVQAGSYVDTIIATVQRLAIELRPGALDSLGLEAAIKMELQRFQQRYAIACNLSLPKTPAALPANVSTAAFRIVQEALTNIARHAQASHVQVSLEIRHQALLLSVSDDGIGISDEKILAPFSLGLFGMRERAEQLGGEVRIRRRSPRGTIVRIRIPILPETRQETQHS